MKLTLDIIENREKPVTLFAEKWFYVKDDLSSRSSELSSTLKLDIVSYEEATLWNNLTPNRALNYLFDFTFLCSFITVNREKRDLYDIHEFEGTKNLLDVYDVEFELLFEEDEDSLRRLLVGNEYLLCGVVEEFNKQRFSYYRDKFPTTPMIRSRFKHYATRYADVKSGVSSKEYSFYNVDHLYREWRKQNPYALVEFNKPIFKTPEDEEKNKDNLFFLDLIRKRLEE